jgi:hypothetical protein
MCVTSEVDEHRCELLKSLCPDYINVAIYVPQWPEDEEYVFSCSAMYYAPIPLSVAATFGILFVIMLCCLMRRQRLAQQSNASTSTEGDSIVRANPRQSIRGRYKRTWHQRTNRYGTLDKYI